MAEDALRTSTEQERTLVGIRACRHADTVGRYTKGLSVNETTRRGIEAACEQLDYRHIVEERARALGDTIPAPPVPSTNPVADLRKALEDERRAARYVVLGSEPLDRHNAWAGFEIKDGIARRITPEVNEDTAHAWLGRARHAALHGTMFPSFCQRGHLQETIGLCGTCLRGTGR